MTTFSTKIFLWFISLIICSNIYFSCAFAENAIITKPESSFVPDVNFFNEAGEKVFLDQFEGKTILLCFWASWCGPCIDELPSLDILQKDFRKLPFEVVAVSEDFNGMEVAKAHFNKYGIRHLKLYHDYKNALFKEMKVIGLPTAFLIDPEGKIKVLFRGNIKWHDEEIRGVLLAEIEGNPPMPKNSYIATSLNKKIAPIMLEATEGKTKTDKPVINKDEKTDSQEKQNDNTNQK